MSEPVSRLDVVEAELAAYARSLGDILRRLARLERERGITEPAPMPSGPPTESPE